MSDRQAKSEKSLKTRKKRQLWSIYDNLDVGDDKDKIEIELENIKTKLKEEQDWVNFTHFSTPVCSQGLTHFLSFLKLCKFSKNYPFK